MELEDIIKHAFLATTYNLLYHLSNSLVYEYANRRHSDEIALMKRLVIVFEWPLQKVSKLDPIPIFALYIPDFL